MTALSFTTETTKLRNERDDSCGNVWFVLLRVWVELRYGLRYNMVCETRSICK